MPQEVTLSQFQKEKLRSFFNFLEPDAKGNLESNSLDRIVKRILDFTKWPAGGVKANHIQEICEAFFEILFEKAVNEGGRNDQASLDDWYHIWSHLLPGCKGMSNFPVWLRLMPKIMFEMIDRDADNLINTAELLIFFKDMMKIDDQNLEQKVKNAVKEMTDDGRYPLNMDGYEQIFANFLIGKTPHGPGKYIFGLFNYEDYHYELIKLSDQTDSSVNVSPPRDRRPSAVRIMTPTWPRGGNQIC